MGSSLAILLERMEKALQLPKTKICPRIKNWNTIMLENLRQIVTKS